MEFFGTVRQKIDGESWYPSPFYAWELSDTRNFLKHRRFPLKFFSTLWDKNSSREKRDAPSLPPLIHKIFRFQKFSETEEFHYVLFRYSETTIFWPKIVSWYSPLMHKIFRYPKLSETPKGSSTKCFRSVIQKIFAGKSWYPPPLMYQKFRY